MKPLTAEEIAELREWSRVYAEDEPPLEINQAAMGGDVDRVNASIVGNAVPRLLDEVERARALLKRIEYVPLGIEEPWYDGCPSCKAPQQLGQTHKPGCELAALIGETT